MSSNLASLQVMGVRFQIPDTHLPIPERASSIGEMPFLGRKWDDDSPLSLHDSPSKLSYPLDLDT